MKKCLQYKFSEIEIEDLGCSKLRSLVVVYEVCRIIIWWGIVWIGIRSGDETSFVFKSRNLLPVTETIPA